MGLGDFLSPLEAFKDFGHTHPDCADPAFDTDNFGVPSVSLRSCSNYVSVD